MKVYELIDKLKLLDGNDNVACSLPTQEMPFVVEFLKRFEDDDGNQLSRQDIREMTESELRNKMLEMEVLFDEAWTEAQEETINCIADDCRHVNGECKTEILFV